MRELQGNSQTTEGTESTETPALRSQRARIDDALPWNCIAVAVASKQSTAYLLRGAMRRISSQLTAIYSGPGVLLPIFFAGAACASRKQAVATLIFGIGSIFAFIWWIRVWKNARTVFVDGEDLLVKGWQGTFRVRFKQLLGIERLRAVRGAIYRLKFQTDSEVKDILLIPPFGSADEVEKLLLDRIEAELRSKAEAALN